MPSGTRNFLGRLVDGILPGTNYNRETGGFQNIGRGIAGLAGRVGLGLVGGPAAGAIGGKLIGRMVDGDFGRGGGGGNPYSFYSMGGNPYGQFGSSYQFPQYQSQSNDPFAAPQPFWSYEQGYQPSSNLGFGQPAKPQGGGGGGAYGGVGGGGGDACVTVDTVLPGHKRAGDVPVGAWLEVVDGKTLEHSLAKVSHSESVLKPCVLIRTANGVELECSESAPIANAEGEQILSVDLLGHKVPTLVNGRALIDVVIEVRPIGEKMVQKITCENKFFLAGKTEGSYLLHHNVKGIEGSGGTVSSYNYMPNSAGLKWGWGWN